MTVQQKKEILKQFDTLDRFIDSLIKDKEHTKSLLNILGSVSDFDAASYNECLKKIDEINRRIVDSVDRLCDLKKRILDAVLNLQSPTERTILWLCYIGKRKGSKYRRMTLWEIGEQLNYSEIRIKQLHIKALQNLNI